MQQVDGAGIEAVHVAARACGRAFSVIAALFVERDGVYADVPGIDAWPIERDARKYDGPWPVVAHPPCNTYSMLANVNAKRYGLKIGDDDGCFVSALKSVRRFGGVLEHPANTMAWRMRGLIDPYPSGWQSTLDGGWVCRVFQRNYGHRARKETWLYAFGVSPPSLIWGEGPPPEAMIGGPSKAVCGIEKMSKLEARTTPIAFRNLLCGIAYGARGTDSPVEVPRGERSGSYFLGNAP